MGREIKRVALDFNWPLDKVWQGYLSPPWRKCPNPDCENGYTVAGAWLNAITHLILMTGEAGTNQRPLHPWLAELPLGPGRKPGPDAAALSSGLAGRAPSFIGHDASDSWAATKKIIEAAGLDPATWGICQVCKGNAMHPADQAASEAWVVTEPPAGEGWQMWETVSEGSPITPVFSSAEALVEYLVAKGTTGDPPYRRSAAEAFVKEGWAPSFITTGDGQVLQGGLDADRMEELK
jgi:hypothetical protein